MDVSDLLCFKIGKYNKFDVLLGMCYIFSYESNSKCSMMQP